MNESLATTTTTSKAQFSLFTLAVIVSSIAIGLIYSVNVPATPGQPNPTDPTWRFVFKLTTFLTAFCCTAGLIFVLVDWARTKRFAAQPGHLLALATGFGFLAIRAVDLCFVSTVTELEALDLRL